MKTVKFFITPVYPYGNDHYFHEIVALAEGFQKLGHRIIGNCDYWWIPESHSYLIKGELENESFDIAIYDYRYARSFEHLLFRKGYPNFDRSKKHVLVDRNDGHQPIWWRNDHYRTFDLILSGNLYRGVVYPPNVRPWAIGLTQRIIEGIDQYYQPDALRAAVIGYNFRVDHSLRSYLLKHIKSTSKSFPCKQLITGNDVENETDLIFYNATTRRHNPQYFRILCSTELFLSFGGYFDFKPLRYMPWNFIDKVLRKPNYWIYRVKEKSKRDFSNHIYIFQQDSFRFWEVLYSGSVAVNIDLDHWNVRLPVMPVSGEHYLGIKKLHNNIEEDLSKKDHKILRDIGKKGRSWVLTHYSPQAQAERLFAYLNG
jgi:hypothetical protein